MVHRPVGETIRVGGLEKLSMVDWPGELAAVVFCQGCAWRCAYCHNPHLIPFTSPETPISWRAIARWLETRRGLLDAVVFSGGEPTLQPGLADAMSEARDLGFRIGLHTAGPSPEQLACALPFADWVGFDFKAPFDRYLRVTGHDQGARAQESLRLLRAQPIESEVRTTWHPRLLTVDHLVEMATMLVAEGCDEWVLQRFRANGSDDPELAAEPVGTLPLAQLRERVPALRVIAR
jgi:pyruvate formate lyase activating enzyme